MMTRREESRRREECGGSTTGARRQLWRFRDLRSGGRDKFVADALDARFTERVVYSLGCFALDAADPLPHSAMRCARGVGAPLRTALVVALVLRVASLDVPVEPTALNLCDCEFSEYGAGYVSPLEILRRRTPSFPPTGQARAPPVSPALAGQPPSFPFVPTLLTSRPPASRPRPAPAPRSKHGLTCDKEGFFVAGFETPANTSRCAGSTSPSPAPSVAAHASPLTCRLSPASSAMSLPTPSSRSRRDASRRREATPACPPAAPHAPVTPSYRVSRLTRAPTPPPPPRMVISTPPVPRSAARRVFCSDPARRCGSSGASAQSPKNRSACRADRPTPRGGGRGGSARARLR